MNTNRRTRLILTGAIALALVFLSSVFYAEAMGGERGRIMEKLGLTPEQEKQLQEHRNTHREQMKQLSQTLRGKRAELHNELEKQKIDKAKVNSIISEIKPLLSRQVELRVAGILAMREILKPEQFEKLQRFRKRGRGRSGPGRGGPDRRRNKRFR